MAGDALYESEGEREEKEGRGEGKFPGLPDVVVSLSSTGSPRP
jgi:hypothetical protein